MNPSEPSHRKTCKRYDVPGHAHYLTFSCFQRRPFLSGQLAPLWLADAIREARIKAPFHLWAYVFMPEHVHLLVQPIAGSEVSRILWLVKRPVSATAVAHVRRTEPAFLLRMEDRQPNVKRAYRFWQRGGGYDRNIMGDDELLEKITYIHNNPVRRGLVSHPSEWRWSSFRAWMEGVDEPMPIDRREFHAR